jgi:O-antigen/teichoic acid export membrane protein
MKKIISKIGIDKAILYTLLSRVVQAGGGVITLLVVARCLTKVEQGYYYTFGSILAIQVFFELGLSNIITQFVAHENVHLKWNTNISFVGSEESSSRLSSLLRFTIKWFSVIAILLFLGLLISGYVFFNKFGKENVDVNWYFPWIILSITTSLSLMVSPLLAFFEGLGKVKEVARIRLVQQIIQLFLVLLFFSLGFKLFSAPVAAILTFLVIPVWILFGSKIKLLKFVWNKLSLWEVNYRLEIFPYQWKIALSWISGYFIFQLFNPVLFATDGAVVAGQMGMTLTVLNSIFSLAFSWISTKIPVFSNLIARNEYEDLDNLFNKTLIQSTLLNILAVATFFSIIFIMRYFNIKINGKNFADRFLSFAPMIYMIIPTILNHIVGSWATYLRCHKKEPMLIQSLIIGVLCSLSTVLLGNLYGVIGITMGYMVITIISFIWTYFTFSAKKREWHN